MDKKYLINGMLVDVEEAIKHLIREVKVLNSRLDTIERKGGN